MLNITTYIKQSIQKAAKNPISMKLTPKTTTLHYLRCNQLQNGFRDFMKLHVNLKFYKIFKKKYKSVTVDSTWDWFSQKVAGFWLAIWIPSLALKIINNIIASHALISPFFNTMNVFIIQVKLISRWNIKALQVI